jgi:hypothetical protein
VVAQPGHTLIAYPSRALTAYSVAGKEIFHEGAGTLSTCLPGGGIGGGAGTEGGGAGVMGGALSTTGGGTVVDGGTVLVGLVLVGTKSQLSGLVNVPLGVPTRMPSVVDHVHVNPPVEPTKLVEYDEPA